MGAKNYDVNSYLNGQPAATLAVFQLPGSNALETAELVRDEDGGTRRRSFRRGSSTGSNTIRRCSSRNRSRASYHTLIEAFVLVFIVVLVFLQNWRATIIPMVAVPVSLIGTLACMRLFGFSLNNLSLFGLVLAIGIVVDDAIVVVENVERLMATGLSPREASRKAMDEVTGPVIAIALVLCAVFVPTASMAGISGQFYKQFALTIAASTIISAFNSLTLSPALAALLLKPHSPIKHGTRPRPARGAAAAGDRHHRRADRVRLSDRFRGAVGRHREPRGRRDGHGVAAPCWLRLVVFAVGAVVGWLASKPVNLVLGKFFDGFNWVFDTAIKGYGTIVGMLLRTCVIGLVVYGGLMVLTFLGFRAAPTGFIPEQDKGYLVVNAQLPDGASLERSDELIRRLSKVVREVDGVAHTIDLAGYSTILSTNISNVGGMFVILEPFEERAGIRELSAPAVMAKLRELFQEFPEAQIAVFGAPPVEGLGSTGGFKLQVRDVRGAGLRALQGAVQNFAEQTRSEPGLVGVFSTFSVAQPQLYVEIDREKVKAQNVSLDEVHTRLAGLPRRGLRQ